jgi:hypothetical protein
VKNIIVGLLPKWVWNRLEVLLMSENWRLNYMCKQAELIDLQRKMEAMPDQSRAAFAAGVRAYQGWSGADTFDEEEEWQKYQVGRGQSGA